MLHVHRRFNTSVLLTPLTMPRDAQCRKKKKIFGELLVICTLFSEDEMGETFFFLHTYVYKPSKNCLIGRVQGFSANSANKIVIVEFFGTPVAVSVGNLHCGIILSSDLGNSSRLTLRNINSAV
ncbi:uncharacterized protein [Fopius arisanus]|uniref:Uncharacterized protein n=1 Tax=Fopius arisanus TaxID=64838 RepID=A0A9R1TAK3_9HYME|nr:PREDICTED: uncharacterized protein LOC105268018 [Fopius arisanus]